MTIITAMIQPFILNKATSALEAIEGFPGMTVTEARRFMRRRNLLDRRAPQFGEFKEKLCVEIVTPDEKARQTGETDDGRADATLTLRIARSRKSREPA